MNLLKQRYRFVCFLFILIVTSCSTYKPVVINRRLITDSKIDRDNPQSFIQKKKRQNLSNRYKFTKYFVTLKDSLPVSKLNDKAVEYATNHEYSEAVFLFTYALREKLYMAEIYNNLGVTYELSGEKALAFKMYSRACLLKPENSFFRSNFLSLTFVEQPKIK